MIYRFEISPVAKPRMTVSDKWKHRAVVERYFAYRDRIRYESRLKGLEGLPDSIDSIVFALPMPTSWSQKKKDLMRGKPHQQTPDLSNILKGLEDVWQEDKHIHSIRNLQKIWDDSGSIILEINGRSDSEQRKELNLFDHEQSSKLR